MSYKNVTLVAQDLQSEFTDLTQFEALQIAVKLEGVDAFKKAFMVSDNPDNLTPVALEGIAMALGMTPVK